MKLHGLALAALLLGGCASGDAAGVTPPLRVGVTTVEAAAAVPENVWSATVQARTQVPLAFNQGGYVESLATVDGRPLEPGDRVRRGQVLASLRQSDFQDRVDQASTQLTQAEANAMDAEARVGQAEAGVQQAEAQVSEAQAGVLQARGAVRQAEATRLEAVAGVRAADAQLDNARANFERSEVLFGQKSLTAANMDNARAQYRTAMAQADQAREDVRAAEAALVEARAQLLAAEAKVAEARSQVAQASSQVQQARAGSLGNSAGVPGARAQLREAQRAMDDSSLKSPVDGVVLQRNVEIGALVGAGTVGYTVADLARVKAVFGVPDTVMARMKVGERVTVVAAAAPDRTFHGRVISLSPAADPTTRVYQVEVALDNPRQALKAGMVVTLSLKDDPAAGRPVITLPLTAVASEEGDVFRVYTVDGDVAVRREVRLGEVVGNRVVVTEGLKPGDRVVTEGATRLSDGVKVQVAEP